MKVLIRLILICCIAGILGFGVFALQQKKKAELAAFAQQPRPLTSVSAVSVKRETWQQYLPAIGSVNAVQQVDVTSEVEGIVKRIHFESGQSITAGDVLVTLDTSVDEAELRGVLAELRLAELQFKRSQRLRKDRTISEAEYDIAEAERDEATAKLAAQRAIIAQKLIRAPFSGRLGIRAIDLGQYLEPGMKIVSLQSQNPLYVDFAIPERFVRAVKVGQRITFTVQAYPDDLFEGRVDATEPGIESATRNLRIRALANNDESKLRPGMFVELDLTVPEIKDVLTIPETAVTYTPYGNSVFVIEPGDGGLQVQRLQIETGEIRSGRIAVISGLDEGQQIVALGQNKLRNGMPVRISETVPLGAILPAQ